MLTGGIQRTNGDRIYVELGLYSLSVGRWYQKLLFINKRAHNLFSAYLTAYITFASERGCNTRSPSQRYLQEPICRTKISQSSFFLFH